MATFFDEIRRNNIRSALIIALFFVLVLAVGAFIGLYWSSGAPYGIVGGIVLAFIVGGLYALIAWISGGRMILATTGAKKVTKKGYAHLCNTVEGLAIAAGVPAPECYVIEDSALNAFATGRDPAHSAICVTTGLLEKLDRQELEGVIAHEMAHIKNYDIRVMMLAAVLVGVLTLLGDILLRSVLWGRNDRDSKMAIIALVAGIVLAILSPLIGELIRLSISRRREFLADATGAMLTRYPPGLASALEKIAADPDPLVDKANRATAHLFISTPFRKKRNFFVKIFSTHPPIEERITRLRAM